jgi:hypothetical protein
MPDLTRPLGIFHRQHGGDELNWSVTAGRLMSVYLKPPILKGIYQQFNPTGSCESPSADDYRKKLLGKVVQLNQLHIRFCQGQGQDAQIKIYATMGNPSNSHTDSITLISPSEPAFKNLLENKKVYQCEMNLPP